MYRVKYVDKNNWIYSEKGKVCMKSTEKIAEEIIIIKYYNVLFYLFFMRERDSLKKQCLVNRLESGELLRMKKIQEWCDYHQIFLRLNLCTGKIFHLQLVCGICIHIVDLKWNNIIKNMGVSQNHQIR